MRLSFGSVSVFARVLPAVSLLLTMVSGDALATVKQPDGTVVPTPVADLKGVFTAAGDPAIDPVVDAQVVPETFKPACSIKFNLISRGGAAYQNIFGWYNVTGSKPPVSDLHVILDCGAAPKSVDTAIRKDPAYKGGEIGFFLVTPENGSFGFCPSLPDNIGSVGGGSKNAIYYSEAGLNPDSTAASKHVHLLIYDSKALKPAFYFAWEDLYAGGDNEFTDLVARVDNIVCAAAGEVCDTGKLGICKIGAKSCEGGTVVCKDAIKPGAKKCNGLDNDCDGKLDDGPCPDGTICTRGACIPKCGSGEFKCTGGLVCDMGICVEASCVGKTCPDGKTCVKGTCVDACTDVVCPTDKVCRVGVCVDPCAGISCGADEVCEKGVCIASCTCAGCPDKAKTCDTTTRHCVAPTCVGKTCAKGTHCESGTCVDDCAKATCPAGQECVAGDCIAKSGGGDAGTDGGATPDGSIDFDTGAGSDDASTDDTGGTPSGFDQAGDVSGGCGCRANPRESSGAWSIAALLALGLFTARRR